MVRNEIAAGSVKTFVGNPSEKRPRPGTSAKSPGSPCLDGIVDQSLRSDINSRNTYQNKVAIVLNSMREAATKAVGGNSFMITLVW